MHACEKELVTFLDFFKYTSVDIKKQINENTYIESNVEYFRVVNYATELFRMYRKIDSKGNRYYIGHLRYVNTVTSRSRLRAILKWLYPNLSLPLNVIFEKSKDNMVTYRLTRDTISFYTRKETGELCYSITLNAWDDSRPKLED